MYSDFQTTTHGKWILAGEHSVVRGHSALVFPIKEKKLCLSYCKPGREISADYKDFNGSEIHSILWSVLEQGQKLLGKPSNILEGYFHLSSDIPVGFGMGASAALCVAVARWFVAQNLLNDDSIFSFARDLENNFHGKSSGLDIAGVSAESGILFQKGQFKPIKQSWQPQWFLSSCGEVGITSQCIQQVQNLWQANPEKAALIDKQMTDCVVKASEALEEDKPDSLTQLAKAIQQAADCFKDWGLISKSMQQHMQSLVDSGAMAVKPTGSGNGGYIVSLWGKTPDLRNIELIAV